MFSTLDHIVRVMLPHLDAARARGWRVGVACQVTRFGDDLAQHTDVVYDLPMQRFPLHPANLTALTRLVRLIRRERPTIVHCHNPTGGFIGRLAATIARTSTVRVYTAHGFHFHRQGKRLTNALYRTVETVAGRLLSDAVLVINHEDDAAARGTVVASDRLFLTSGVGVSARDEFDPARFSPASRAALRRTFGVESDCVPVLAAVGEMIPRKRHEDALRAFALLRHTRPDAVLLLVGDGALEPHLRTCAAELGVAERVRFLGFRRDVAAILSAVDVFVFPSQQEGLPCSIQEALSMEVPVVATNIRGCADLVDSSCGCLVAPGDIAGLAAGLEQMVALSPEETWAKGQTRA